VAGDHLLDRLCGRLISFTQGSYDDKTGRIGRLGFSMDTSLGTALFYVLVVLTLVAVSVIASVWYMTRSFSIVERWAERNGYRIIRQDSRVFFRGPFSWNSSNSQDVYRVTVEDRSGNRKSGWIRCGGWFLGPLLSDDVEEAWDR
jgi:hypothetical protein